MYVYLKIMLRGLWNKVITIILMLYFEERAITKQIETYYHVFRPPNLNKCLSNLSISVITR